MERVMIYSQELVAEGILCQVDYMWYVKIYLKNEGITTLTFNLN